MNTITTHRAGSELGEAVEITILDEKGQGGAHHEYEICLHGTDGETCIPIWFQNGPIKEAGLNGIPDEALLAILINRARGFATGPYGSHDNDMALAALQMAMHFKQKRTIERIARGVEGTHQK